jgi:hypothetical protein
LRLLTQCHQLTEAICPSGDEETRRGEEVGGEEAGGEETRRREEVGGEEVTRQGGEGCNDCKAAVPFELVGH